MLDVALERPGLTGRICGRVVDATGPLAGVPVALDYTTIPLDTLLREEPGGDGDAPDVPLLGSGVKTDASGRFEIRGLSPGTYAVDAAYLPDDGYCTTYDEAGIVEIQGSETVDVGDIRVVPAIVPLSPANGEVVHSPRPVLRWTAVSGADYYQLNAGSGHFLEFERQIAGGTAYEFEFDLPAGTPVRWSVTAYRTAPPYDEQIAAFEAIQTFFVSK